MATTLVARWQRLMETFQVPKAIDQKWISIVQERYKEKQRSYHTLDHLNDMFTHLDSSSDAVRRPELVTLAIIFHDIIYDPKQPKDNEEESAKLYGTFIEETQSKELLESCLSVQDWILATKTHQTAVHQTGDDVFGDKDLHYFLDFDMAVLGRPTDGYKEYADQIEIEYGHIPKQEYCKKRAQVLKKFLTVPKIFATRLFHGKFEMKARENIQAEIERLEKRAEELACQQNH